MISGNPPHENRLDVPVSPFPPPIMLRFAWCLSQNTLAVSTEIVGRSLHLGTCICKDYMNVGSALGTTLLVSAVE